MIVWLASYPKSGNTWVATLLTNLMRPVGQSEPADINDLVLYGTFAASKPFLDLVSVDYEELPVDVGTALRPNVWRTISKQADGDLFVRIHDAYSAVSPQIPLDQTKAVIHIVRDPRDVAVSLAHHQGSSVDRAISLMADPGANWSGDRGRAQQQLPQRLGTWSENATSWLGAATSVLTVRYEDLLTKAELCLEQIAAQIGVCATATSVRAAIDDSRFELLAAQEEKQRFRGSGHPERDFFRCGKSGDWKTKLTALQSRALRSEHGAAMKRFGYL